MAVEKNEIKSSNENLDTTHKHTRADTPGRERERGTLGNLDPPLIMSKQ